MFPISPHLPWSLELQKELAAYRLLSLSGSGCHYDIKEVFKENICCSLKMAMG